MEDSIDSPSKRRRLSCSTARYSTSQADYDSGKLPSETYRHEVGNHGHLDCNLTGPLARIEKVHVKLRQRSVSRNIMQDTHHRLHRRQGTAASDSSTAVVSVVASVDADGSTTALSTILPSVPAVPPFPSTLTVPSVPAYPFTSTTTLLVSSSASASSSADITTSSSTTGASTLSSTESSTSAGPDGMIGYSPTAGATEPTTTSSDPASISVSTYISSSNATLTSTGSSGISLIAGTVIGYTAETLSAASGTTAANLTTSATTFVSNGATFTSSSIFALGSSASSSPSASASSSVPLSTSASQSSSTDGIFIFLATLEDGSVATITESSRSYVTTFSDGIVSTIPAYSAVATSAPSLSTLPDGSVSVVSEGATSSTGATAATNGITSVATTAGGSAAGIGGMGSSTATGPASTSTTKAATGDQSNNTPPASVLAGGVVGGVAGLAALLLVAMLFLRWYRGRNAMQALPGSASNTPEPSRSRQPGMAERAGLAPLVAAVPALFRHHNRSPEDSQQQPSERGFTRVSGRKLPSSFSPGMAAAPLSFPLAGGAESRNLSTTSFYRDSQGFYGGEGPASPTSPGVLADEIEKEKMMMSPGPARTPTLHPGGPYMLSPTATPPMSPSNAQFRPGSPMGHAAGIARGETPTSFDGSRGSRFTEEV